MKRNDTISKTQEKSFRRENSFLTKQKNDVHEKREKASRTWKFFCQFFQPIRMPHSFSCHLNNSAALLYRWKHAKLRWGLHAEARQPHHTKQQSLKRSENGKFSVIAVAGESDWKKYHRYICMSSNRSTLDLLSNCYFFPITGMVGGQQQQKAAARNFNRK